MSDPIVFGTSENWEGKKQIFRFVVDDHGGYAGHIEMHQPGKNFCLRFEAEHLIQIRDLLMRELGVV